MASVAMHPEEILVPSLVPFTSKNSLSGEFRPHRPEYGKHTTCDSLANATGDAKPLYLEFGHDTSILLPLSAMGLNKSVASRTE
jgi:acid phosphatase